MEETICTAIDIPTATWNAIIDGLIQQGWRRIADYSGFDKGIDKDYLILRSEEKSIIFGWTNWFEGEIRADWITLDELALEFDLTITIGQGELLEGKLLAILTKIQSRNIKR
ncbi:MAG: hypothetical protein AAFY71_04265 [Bacteroidota bacterium]